MIYRVFWWEAAKQATGRAWLYCCRHFTNKQEARRFLAKVKFEFGCKGLRYTEKSSNCGIEKVATPNTKAEVVAVLNQWGGSPDFPSSAIHREVSDVRH